jgi:hypothetical protein
MELHVVEDRDGASESLYMRCTGRPLHGFEFLPSGDVLVSARHPIDGGQTPVDLLVLRPNPVTSQCEEVRNLTNNTTTEGVSRDFALSPDKSRVALFHGTGTGTTEPASGTLRLATVPVDGSSAPSLVPGADNAPADPGVGPRWIAGGARITWGQLRDLDDSGLSHGSGQISAVDVTGGAVKRVTQGRIGVNETNDYEGQFAFGIGQGCDIATGPLPSLVGLGSLGSAAATLACLLARRSRRRLPPAPSKGAPTEPTG